jgi:hypothetical protein
VLEDSPEICLSESSGEYSDHGEELSDAYVGEVFDENGQSVLSRAVMTTEQAELLRNRGRGGVINRSQPAVFDQNETCKLDYCLRQHHG